jgi:hypothetical protein
MPFMLSLVFPLMIRNMDISDLQVKIHKRMLDNAATYVVLSTDKDSPESWLAVGEAFMNIAIGAEENKISMGIMQASIENPQDRKILQKQINTSKLPQMFFRLGYCDLVHKHSPRRSLTRVLIK